MYFFAILSVILKITGQTVNGGCSPRNITLVRIYVYMSVYHFNGCPILRRFKCIYWLKSCQHESRAANLLTKSPNTTILDNEYFVGMGNIHAYIYEIRSKTQNF